MQVTTIKDGIEVVNHNSEMVDIMADLWHYQVQLNTYLVKPDTTQIIINIVYGLILLVLIYLHVRKTKTS